MRITAITVISVVLLQLTFAVSHGQHMRVVAETESFIDYHLDNPELHIVPPDYLFAPWENQQARFRIVEQEIIPVTVDSTRAHLAEFTERYLIEQTHSPIVSTGEPAYSRGHMMAPLTVHIARQQGTDSPTFQVIRSIRIRIYKPSIRITPKSGFSTLSTNSPLQSGDWFKIPIEEDHLYRIDKDYLDNLGLDTGSIDPRNIQVWGTNGYKLPHHNLEPRSEFAQIPIIVNGEGNGSFDNNDEILFFANSPNRIFFDGNDQRFKHELHPYTRQNFVFLTVGNEPGKRLHRYHETRTAELDVYEFTDFRWLEEEREKPEARIKSGLLWFGQALSTANPTQSIFTDTIPGYIPGSDVSVHISMAARSVSLSRFNFSINGHTGIPNLAITAISSYTDATGFAARINTISHTATGLNLDDDIVRIHATYVNTDNQARAWVNWIRLYADRTLTAQQNQLHFYPPQEADNRIARFHLQGFDEAPYVLDITDPTEPRWLDVESQGDYYTTTSLSGAHHQYFATSTNKRPADGTLVSNQNIRNPGLYPDYVIITAEELRDHAVDLAEYRQSNDGLTPVVVTQQQIFNEFSGGVPDVTAIRDYVKHLYDRGIAANQQQPLYLLIFGNTTFDYKNILNNPTMRNLVFTYQSEESLQRDRTYASDDYFTFMGDEEGLWAPTDTSLEIPDLGVGRIPVQTPEEAAMFIDKIKTYEDPRNRGDWQTLFTFIADDDIAGRNNDRDLHILNADGTAAVIDMDDTGIRLDKIYQISYPYINTGAGLRVPEATNAMIDRINNGTLIFNFSGHGAEQFLTDQRLFTSDDIYRLHNRNKLSIMVTATCSFGRFDDSDDYSGAEKLLLHPDGGIIAAYTTSRVVYTSSIPTSQNYGLNIQLTREMTKRDREGKPLRLGDIYRETKSTPIGRNFNSRKFTLLGDPAMRLGLPETQSVVTHINDHALSDSVIINLRSLDQVTVQGHIMRPDSSVDATFSGEANVRVFDASRLVRYPDKDWVIEQNCHLPNCGYNIQTDLLFNGRVSVENGEFSSTFVIPKDVSYSSNPGRIQVYAHERHLSAVGSTSGFRIQGQNPDAVDNKQGPDIEIYLNDELFLDGGIVNDNPNLIVLLSDDFGINTTGAGVGHEIVAIIENIDNPTDRKTIPLNDFYQSNLDDFTSGRIEYPLDGLNEGTYLLRIRAWDVFNNMGESEITFQVLDGKDLQLRNVFNYPNPMHNFTSFVFEHNQPGNPLDIRIRIFTPSGQPVATIRREQFISNGNMVRIDWHGRDDDMHRLATGTYLYHVQVATQTSNGRQVKDKIERLVILR